MALFPGENRGALTFPGQTLPQTTGEPEDVLGYLLQNQQRVEPWTRTFETLREIAVLTDDWDGLGAKAPSTELHNSAVEFAQTLQSLRYKPPSSVVPTPDGTLLFTWRGEFFYRDAEITEAHRAEWMQIIPGQLPSHWAEWPRVYLQAA